MKNLEQSRRSKLVVRRVQNDRAAAMPLDYSRLERVARLSAGQAGTGNKLIQGENLRVLNALREEFVGAVRLVYIDPPYNNRENYRHYNDDLGHEEWLRGLVARLEVLAAYLRPDGSLWISIDDREVHYLKVAADRVLGRNNFITTVVWQHRTTRENRRAFSNNHEYILVYAKDAKRFRQARNLLPPTPAIMGRYKNPDADPRGPWQSVSLSVQDGHATAAQFYDLVAPNGHRYRPPKGRCWAFGRERMSKEIAANNVWFGSAGNSVPRWKRFLDAAHLGINPETLWTADDVGTSDAAKKHSLQLFPGEPVFDTPKPESLIQRVLEIGTDPGDLVLDSYLGSGTTAATAHKMGRRYIGIEQGAQVVSLCATRLKKVIAGEPGGISRSVGWQSGGGFDFFRLV